MIDLSSLADKWPSALVAREQIGTFTGGFIAPGTMANIEKKAGIRRIRIGHKIGYRVEDVVRYLESIASDPNVTADELLLAKMERVRSKSRRGK